MVSEIEIGIAIEISISNENRDRERDLNFGDRGHAFILKLPPFSVTYMEKEKRRQF